MTPKLVVEVDLQSVLPEEVKRITVNDYITF